MTTNKLIVETLVISLKRCLSEAISAYDECGSAPQDQINYDGWVEMANQAIKDAEDLLNG